MRVTGNFEASDGSQNQDATTEQGFVPSGAPNDAQSAAQAQSPQVGFEPFAFRGFSPMMPPPHSWTTLQKKADKKKVYFSEPEASGYSSTEEPESRKKQRGAKLPPFAKKWFELSKEKKEELRQLKQQWATEQVASGNPNPHSDVEGLKKIMPKFAAKWLVLPEEEQEKYRTMKKAAKLEKTDGKDIPAFATKWFSLSEKKKNEFRKIKRRLKMSRKSWMSDGDGEGDQSEPEIDYQREGVPPFAAKWFSLPKAKKDEIRVKYRHHKKCKKTDCEGLEDMINMMRLQGPWYGATMPPMMYPYTPYSGYPMPWTGPFYQQGYPMCAPPGQPHMCAPCPMAPPYCVLKRFHKAQKAKQHRRGWTTDTSDEESKGQDMPTTGSESDDDGTQMPEFVKKWFSLPMQARQQLRMWKRQQKHNKSGDDTMPPFANKWFALDEKTKQKMRKLNRQHKHVSKAEQTTSDADPDVATNQPPCDPAAIEVELPKSEAAAAQEIPEFARVWFSLPVEQKYHLRMLNRYLSSKSDSDTTDDEYEEKMPDFAAQWFALNSEQRQHLRDLKHQGKAKKGKGFGHKKGCKRSAGFSANPWWRRWAFHAMPPMGYFYGNKHGRYHSMSSDDKKHGDYE